MKVDFDRAMRKLYNQLFLSRRFDSLEKMVDRSIEKNMKVFLIEGVTQINYFGDEMALNGHKTTQVVRSTRAGENQPVYKFVDDTGYKPAKMDWTDGYGNVVIDWEFDHNRMVRDIRSKRDFIKSRFEQAGMDAFVGTYSEVKNYGIKYSRFGGSTGFIN